MAQSTGIEWTDATSNPLRYRDRDGKDVWGCVKVSAGCAHCYAEAIATRWERGGPFTKSKMDELESYVADRELQRLLRSRKLAGKRVFVSDMTDLFGEWVPDELIDQVFAAMALRQDITFQVLTKRSHWMRRYFAKIAEEKDMQRWANAACLITQSPCAAGIFDDLDWPLPNVWLGVSTENQEAADKRIPDLLKTPAAVRFLSVEPLLGPIDLARVRIPLEGTSYMTISALYETDGLNKGKAQHKVDWVIVGGESGGYSRWCNIGWIRSIVEQCKAADVACFVKQVGSRPMYEQPAKGCGTHEVYVTLNSHKGNDMEEWPEDLRVRQFPAQPEEAAK